MLLSVLIVINAWQLLIFFGYRVARWEGTKGPTCFYYKGKTALHELQSHWSFLLYCLQLTNCRNTTSWSLPGRSWDL